MKEININEAIELWKKRLSDNCINRIATGCNHDFSREQCNIIICPRLGEAQLKRVFMYRDLMS